MASIALVNSETSRVGRVGAGTAVLDPSEADMLAGAKPLGQKSRAANNGAPEPLFKTGSKKEKRLCFRVRINPKEQKPGERTEKTAAQDGAPSPPSKKAQSRAMQRLYLNSSG